MENLLNNIEETLLMGPGPSYVHDSVYKALSQKTIGHLDPYFIQIMDGIKSQLKQLLNTKNELTIPVSGTGSAGMETCFVNLIEKDDPVLILINGVFGKRMEDVTGRLGANVDVLDFEWGTPVRLDDVKRQLESKSYKIVAIVHAETSTGVCNPIEEIGSLLKGSDSLYLVDAVTSFGGMDIKMDQLGIDVLYTGTQKCLSCPPGLAPISFSNKAVEVVKKRKTKVPNWYLDLTMIINYWEGSTRAYHHTAPINMLYGLYQSLFNIIEEGAENVYQRHKEAHQLLVEGLQPLKIEMLVEAPFRLPMLNSVKIPDGVNEAQIRQILLKDHKIEIGAGLGPLAGKIWRIGLMGHTAYPHNVNRLVQALQVCLTN
jgi:alanine-glyoxylate transaminase / serine-glyoxylate transaminase / serine-pyruvate transaminase